MKNINSYILYTVLFIALLFGWINCSGSGDSAANGSFLRGPYLQLPSAETMNVIWRSNGVSITKIKYGRVGVDEPEKQVSDYVLKTYHEVTLTDLKPETRYFYAIYKDTGSFSENYYFKTAPVKGDTVPFRAWILGDSGDPTDWAKDVRDGFYRYNDSKEVDVWMMLGDNAYVSGTTNEYDVSLFKTFPETLSSTPLFPNIGIHDLQTDKGAPYFSLFHLPTNGESGGYASATEEYYSFDYGNAHFVVLNSEREDVGVGSNMYNWFVEDLESNDQTWTIISIYRPPYSDGGHDSDLDDRMTEIREIYVKLFDKYGVDLVLSGHSHNYERSRLIRGHTGLSETYDEDTMVVNSGDGNPDGDGAYNKNLGEVNNGVVYIVAGASSKLTWSAQLLHPAMPIRLRKLGSVVLDFDANELSVKYVERTAVELDRFTIMKK